MSDDDAYARLRTHPIMPSAGRGDGTDWVRFYESSAVTAIRYLDDVELPIDGPFPWLAVGDKKAHLTGAEIARLHDRLGQWLSQHPAPAVETEKP